VVDICLPTDRHAPAATSALRAGKHVLLEKPVALNVAAADALIKEAARSGRILMGAHVLRFFPAYRKLAQLIRQGAPARSALFRRKCAAPAWSPWLIDPARSGGGIMDLLIHDADYCISLWGKPASVHARGYRDLSRGIDVIHAELTWPGLGPVIISGGWHQSGSLDNPYPFSMEFSVVSEAATLEWSSVTEDFRQYSSGSQSLKGYTQSLPLEEEDAFVAQLSYFAACVKAGAQPELCPPAQSAMAVALIGKMVESRENNGKVIQC
jgi:predicted dehydrogenase